MNRRIRHAAVLLSLAGLLLTTAGCSIIGVFSHVLNPPRVDPLYVPAKTMPMLVLVENRQNPGMLIPEAEELANYIGRELEGKDVAPMVSPTKVQELRDRDPQAARMMSISALGREVGAGQVLYVDVVNLQATEVVGMPTTGSAELRVHVVDAQSGRTLWPTESYLVRYESTGTQDFESGRERGLREKVLRGAAIRVARLFYRWDPAEEEK
jgi:hypothetical protein